MKYSSQFAALLASLFITTAPSYALNPVQGWYAGLFIGVSSEPANYFTSTAPLIFPNYVVPANSSGNLSHKVLGGIGGEMGYRCNRFRVEGQILYNNNPYRQLTIDSLVIKGQTSSGSSSAVQISGDTNLGAVFANGFYDIFTPNQDNWSQVVPYLGLGVGYAYIQNAIQFYYNDTILPLGNIREIHRSVAGQGIIGLNYFMDDFTTIGLDFRYLTTQNKPTTFYLLGDTVFNSRLNLYSVNLIFNGSFDA